MDGAHAEFVHLLTHELRQGLQAMLGFAQLMDRDATQPLPERQRQRVRRVLDAGDHLLHLADSASALSRLFAGQVAVRSQAVDVLDVLEHVRAVLGPAAMGRRIQVSIGACSSLSERPVVTADAGSFAQVLIKLGTNAIEHNKPLGRVVFDVSSSGPSQLRISVIDTGTGIAADVRHKLFSPFPNITRTNTGVQGAGLGLVMCRSLVELMAGTIGYREMEHGSEFWVDLPMHGASG